jgi:hypothetical protein
MNKLVFSAPINALSFGNVSYNILRELYKLNIDLKFFPVGKDLDFSAFDKTEDEFKSWIVSSYNSRLKNISKDVPSLKLWHLNGSESGVGPRQNLFTFHETDQPTEDEISITNLQENTIFSSSFSKSIFKETCSNSHFVPIGFDEDFHETNKKYLSGRVHFGLMGKWEKRKHTGRIIKLWAKKYGNNNDYQLSCCVTNPFFGEDDFKNEVAKTLDGVKYTNINFLPRLKTNSEVNDYLNSLNIDLSGLSGAEGWNLPSFNSTALGKWSIVLNATAHKDWATEDNSILVQPSGKEECYDNLFFKKENSFNQGSINTFTDDDFYNAIDQAISKHEDENIEGKSLREKFTYKETVNKILNIIK